MPGPNPKDPATRERRNKSSTKAVLSLVVDHEVPPMPKAEDWISHPTINGQPVGPGADKAIEWSPVVLKWWKTIWSSPMSNEYHDSDTVQLHLACFYLHQTVNPFLKMAERLQASKAHEACVKNFGLSPMSRRALQWEIARVTAADLENEKRKARSAGQGENKPAPQADPRDDEDEDEANPFAADNVTQLHA